MRTIFLVLSSLLTAALADKPVIDTPTSIVQCLPSSITFSGGTAPYFITVIPGGQINAPPLQDLGQTSQSPLVWMVPQPPGTSISLQIRDSDGQLNYSQQVSVQPGKSDCSSTPTTASSPAPSATPSPTPPAGSNTSTTSNNPPAAHNTTDSTNTTNAHTPPANTTTVIPSKTNPSSPANASATKPASIFTTPSTNPAAASTATSTPAAGASSSAPASFKLTTSLMAVSAAGVIMALSM